MSEQTISPDAFRLVTPDQSVPIFLSREKDAQPSFYLDIVEAYLFLDRTHVYKPEELEVKDANELRPKWVDQFIEWINNHHSVILTTSQAWILSKQVVSAFDGLKKNLDAESKSLTNFENPGSSTPRNQSSTSSTTHSPDSTPLPNSAIDE